MIRQDISVVGLKDEFILKGSLVIRDFLQADFVEKISSFLSNGMPKDWWYSVSSPGTSGSVRFIRDFEENKEIIETERLNSEKFFNSGLFSYHFYRTAGDHVSGCWCEECNFRNWLNSNELLNFLSEVSGYKLSAFTTMFASKYSDGCFLSPHHDESLGRVGFVLQLTKNWLPQWGGVLHFLNDSMDKIEYSESPTFNTLTLFHIPEGRGKNHYVSHVSSGVTSFRIAYSGWYS